MALISGSTTETMVSALEAFQEAEPEAILIIYLDENGALNYRSNIESDALRIGMCESLSAALKAAITH